MAWRQVLDLYDVLDSAEVDGEQVAALLRAGGVADVTVQRAQGEPRSSASVLDTNRRARSRSVFAWDPSAL